MSSAAAKMTEELPKSMLEHFNKTASTYETTTGGSTRAVARHLISMVPPSSYRPEAVILDNAAGTGIVADEILRLHPSVAVKIVDAAESMLSLAENILTAAHPAASAAGKLSFSVMPGEKLDFPDNHFDLSFTNFGIFAFEDPAAGAHQIYRTLKPGGTAVLTVWKELGYLDHAFHPAQAVVRPDDPPFTVPVAPDWFDPSRLQKLMAGAGFQHVDMSTSNVYYGRETLEELVESHKALVGTLVKVDWPEQEVTRFLEVLEEKVRESAVAITLPYGAAGFGLPMAANVAVCRKME